MRIPYKINKNTHLTYEASPESLILVGEPERQILSENFQWDKNHCPSLATLCVEVIKSKFTDNSLLDELPCQDRDYLLEILDLALPLQLVVPLIEDEIYWQRRYQDKFGTIIYRKRETWTWKSLFIERHVQEMIEQAQPEHNDEDEMDEILTLCSFYVRTLIVSQLQAWKPPLHWDEEDIPEFHPTDHISFEPIFKKLVHIEEFDVIYGMNSVGDKFTWHMFKLSVGDCQRLGKSLHHLKSLRILRIHRSRLEDQHVRVLMHGLIKNETLEELDLSHCIIGNQGALCIAKVLCVHPKLRSLNLCDNKIGQLGCEGLGFALLEPECSLEKLNLKLNPLGEGGAMGIMRALVRGTKLEEFSMAACQFDDDAPIRTGQMLLLNKSLKKLDVSNNWFDEEGGNALVEGMAVNRTLEWLDIRETDITSNQYHKIKEYLKRNRLGLEEVNEVQEEVSMGQVEQASYSTVSTQKTAETGSVME
ncbi:dynein regulatory complex subunit 5-like [Tribolium madens]|uniref:dynein regulatory complex subunit 5-like n=1 Tax=Tribolium madens TaxID=41895 RepID=UPI001CF751F7|nr:dynein regulatory complex subunit 5-like [Tribolium madens]